MKAAPLRAGSVPVIPPAASGSTRVFLSRHCSIGGIYSGERAGSSISSPIISLHFPMDKRKLKQNHSHIRRAFSDTDLVKWESRFPGGSRCFESGIPEEEYASDGEIDREFQSLVKGNGSDRASFAPVWLDFISNDKTGFPSDAFGNGGKSGGDNRDYSFGDKSKIGDYYQEMLKLNPNDSLLLRNYGRFLYEVEKDMERAEEYYGRAILANPGDGKVLALYGKLIWERHRDESRAKSYFDRAKSYFDRAITASPDDCMVMGSYAHFMWEAEEEEEEEEKEMEMGSLVYYQPWMI